MNDIAIKISGLGKCYEVYDQPSDRLKQMVRPRLYRLLRRQPKQYFREFWALKDISLDVKKGQTVGIIGANGSGKSTLLQLISGTLNPTCGTVEIRGRIAALLELGSGFNPEFTGRENVFLNGAILGLDRSEMEREFANIEAFAEIGDFIDQPVKTYSSGMVVRLAFAVSVHINPDVLIVDEALAVGDAAFQFKCLQRLEELTASGTTLLFVSHDLNLLKMFCNHVVYLKEGLIRAAGSAEDVTNIYIMDLREAQSGPRNATRKIGQKAALTNGFSYGTHQGKITDCAFAQGGHLAHFVKEDEISFWAEMEFDDSLSYPSLSVIVENAKKIQIGGQYFPIKKTTDTSLHKLRVTCSFTAKFVPGSYFVSVRLEDRFTHQNFLVVDKQSSALSFEIVMADATAITGMVDLGITLSQQES
jgi:lipopolysaccharide transport system ATP-binding protein